MPREKGGTRFIYAASLGYEVLGLDISEAGLNNSQSLAKKKNLQIDTLATDLDNYEFEENAFDLVICFYFLDRKLFPGIRKTLKPGGLVIYETFTTDHMKHSGLKREWVLETNELLREFQMFRVLGYREVDRDEKGFASIIACKVD